MWSSVTAAGTENGPAPPSRSKHSATLLAGHVYLLGGRNGNLPLKDLWRYSLGEPLNFYACMSVRTPSRIRGSFDKFLENISMKIQYNMKIQVLWSKIIFIF